MKNKTIKINPIRLALMLAGMSVASTSLAVDLVAIEGYWALDRASNLIPMWGFAPDTGQDCTSTTVWTVGPQLTDSDLAGGNLTINLRNCLSEPVSIVIPGQPATFSPQTIVDLQGRTRITSFTTEAAAGGGTASYTWTGVKEGTYLYQSGSHPAKQVQMGLYGALTVGSYAGTSGDVTLLYSEIDPELHNPPAPATPLGYNPRHFLVNGSALEPVLIAGDTNQPTVLRMLNAGLDFHVPALNSGYMSLVAEDGNPYPYAKEQYSANLAAGKTIDALWQPAVDGNHVIYDRRGNGMAASLTVGAGAGAPVAADDTSYSTNEEVALAVAAPGVLANDDTGLTAVLVTAPSSGILSPGLAADGSFTYTPNLDFNGTDSFTYKGNDGALNSNIATVTIMVNPVNDAPVADPNGPYTATVNVPVTLDGSGSSDVDVGETLTYAWDYGDTNIGTGEMPSHAYTATGTYTVSLIVNDGTTDSATATTSVNVVAATNIAPLAVEDVATTSRNTTIFINLTDNDSDVDGNLKDGLGNVAASQISIMTGSASTRNGLVSVDINGNGVNYTPRRNFRGTDTFNYTVTDLDGATSNEVTVRVNIVM